MLNMKTYINISKIRLTVPFVGVVCTGVAIAIVCSAYTVPEGCPPSVTLSTGMNSASGCGSVTVAAECTGNDSSDTVTVSDNGGTGIPIPFYSYGFFQCPYTTWDVQVPNAPITVSLVLGLNKLVANSSELGMNSSEVDYTLAPGGFVWSRTEFYHTPTGRRCPVGSFTDELDWTVSCSCLPRANYAYQETETTDETPGDCFHLPGLDNGADATTDSNYKYSAADYWRIPCKHTACRHTCNLIRHIFDPLVGPTPGGDVTTETVGVTVWWTDYITQLAGAGKAYNWNN